MEKITILIADDHRLVRETWSYILNADKRFNVVATCGSGDEAVDLSRTLLPNVVIMDIDLPGMDGFEATKLILKYSPLTRVLGVSLYNQLSYAKKMFQSGAVGYLTKSSPGAELQKAITEIYNGRKYVCDEIKTIISDQTIINEDRLRPIHSLSPREMEIVSLIKKGNSSKEIASSLNISVRTVEVHRHNILKKLELKNVAALINFIHTNNLD